MIVDSDKVVLRCLQAGLDCRKLLVTMSFWLEWQSFLEDHIGDADVYTAPRTVMEAIVGHKLHHGVVGVFARPACVPSSQWGRRVVLCNGVNNSENVGAIARSAHAFGFDTLVFDESSCSPYVRRAIRVSMGSVFALKVGYVDDLATCLRGMQQQGFHVIGASLASESQSLRSTLVAPPIGVVFGSEGHGICPEVAKACDRLVHIPMVAGIDSLNVAVAMGIVLYQMSTNCSQTKQDCKR